MIAPPEALVEFLKPWADFYGHSKGTETLLQLMHIGGLLLGGGLAISMDRATLRALRPGVLDRAAHLREIAAVHRWVLAGITLIVLSGVALVTADIEAFWGSWIYWVKMALVVALLANGYVMTRTEQGLAKNADETSPHWAKLRSVAVTSLVLWFAIAVLGVALVNFS